MPSTDQRDRRRALEGVSRVALSTLSSLVLRPDVWPHARKPLESYISLMCDAVTDPDPDVFFEVVETMRGARIPVSQIAELYVPVVARRLGEAWCSDRTDFAKVTIGSARLQGLLRRFHKDWDVPRDTKFRVRPAYLVGVPDGVQHTLGACVLAGQLRHRGFSVHLDLELTCESLADKLRNQQFSGVLMSASTSQSLEPLMKLVECTKTGSRDTPVIIGGSILELMTDITSVTGADLATCDLQTALNYCEHHSVARDNSSAFQVKGGPGLHVVHESRSAAE